MLISSDARHKAIGSQLDRQELLGQMELTLGIFKALSELAGAHHAEDTDHKPQEQLLEHVKHLEAGSNTDPASPSPAPGEGRGGGKGGQPIVAISGQAGIAISTPQNTTIATGTNLDMVSAQDASVTTGRHYKLRAAEMISLFARKRGMKLIAAQENIDIEAHDGDVNLTGRWINLTGIEGIKLNGKIIYLATEGAGADIGNGQIITKTLGTHTQHAADHNLTGPAAPDFTPPDMPKSEMKTDEKFVAQYRGSGKPVKQRGYTIRLDNGQTIEAATNDQGQTELLQSDALRGANIKLERD
jgi:type VI secretion system secreted protein VgrG